MLLIDWESTSSLLCNIRAADPNRPVPFCRQYRAVFTGDGKRQRAKYFCGCAVSNGDDTDDFSGCRLDDCLALFVDHPAAGKNARDGVETISEGRFGVQIDTDQIREFAQVSKGFNQMSRRLKTLYTVGGQVAPTTQFGPQTVI